MTKISIIIPVHNAAAYLERCLTSCFDQTLREIEILAIDDCSDDESPALLCALAEKHPDRMRVILLSENLRQGGARNVGIREAKGEYAAFVDSDDWIEPTMCETLYAAAKGADCAGGDYFISTDEGDKPCALSAQAEYTGVMDREKRLGYLKSCGMFWTRIYRTEFLRANDLFFPEHTFYEDAWFNFMTALYAKRIEKTDGAFYHYYQRPDSTMHSRNKPHQYERIGIAERIWDDCVSRGLLPEFESEMQTKFLSMAAANVLYVCLGQFDRPEPDKLSRVFRGVRERLPKYRATAAYRALSVELRFYLRLSRLPRLAIFCYRHGLHRIPAAVSAKINKRKSG